MKNKTLLTRLFVLLSGVILLTSCSNDDDNSPVPPAQPDNSITGLAANNPDLSNLVAALQITGLDEVLATNNGTDTFTVFAPTDEAFLTFLQANGFSSPTEVPTALLQNILLNHVLSGTVTSGSLSTGYVSTLAVGPNQQAVSLYVNTTSGVRLNGVSSVTSADNTASNGVIHVVDAVIPVPTVVDHALANSSFSTLVAALTRTSFGSTFTDLLTGNEGAPFTVFAPTNDAFADVLAGFGLSSLDDIPDDVLETILAYHVVAGANVRSSDLSDNQTVSTVSTQNFTIDLDNGPQIVDGTPFPTNITATDVQAGNGVIHVVDKVLLPPSVVDDLPVTIGTNVVFNPNFSILQAALETADLLGALSDPEAGLTVFAPTNLAFEAFLTNNGLSGLNDVPVGILTQVLLNHVINGELQSTDLSTSYVYTLATETTSEAALSMYINTDSGVVINGGAANGGATVTSANVLADNGVIHVVDNVISLPTVVTFAVADDTFSTLVAALTREESFNFVQTLSSTESPAPFTVFAPTNQAFTDLLTELSLSSLADIPTATLEATLNTHVVAGANVRAEDLTNGQTVTTLGSPLTVDLTTTPQLIDPNARASNIIVTNVQAWNGVIHVIDRVVLPEL